MAISARIDELKKKFDENPRRYFAPLANEYRKAGDLEQAISICRAYLPQQPGHISGHIVFGQALFESGQLQESRGVFETALGLDPENLIALRHLGDIAREEQDLATARGWYQRVLDADPRNEEMAALLQTLPEAEVVPGAEQGAQLNGEAADAAASWRDVNPETTAEIPASPPAPSPAAPRVGATTASAPPKAAPTAAAKPRASLEIENLADDRLMPNPGAAASAAGVERSSEVELGSPAPAAPPRPTPPPPRAPTPAAVDALGLEVMEFVPPAADAAPAPVEGLNSGEDIYSGNVEVAARDDSPPPDAFVTETMAELYLQQGFEQEALAVYRELLARNPSDAALRERVDHLSRGARSSVGVAAISDAVIESAQRRQAARPQRTLRSFLGSMAARRVARRSAEGEQANGAPVEPPHAGPRTTGGQPRVPRMEAEADERWPAREPAPAAPDEAPRPEPRRARPPTPTRPSAFDASRPATNGADSLFPEADVRAEDDAAAHLLARAYTEGLVAAPTSVSGKPTRSAATELSLDHVFREVDRKAPPARHSGGYSFDQFFSEPTPSAPPARASGGSTVDEAEKEGPAPDDIEQFNSWLQGLKKK